jgi:hypothetical protein
VIGDESQLAPRINRGGNGIEGKKGSQAPDASPGQWDGGDGGDFLCSQSRTDYSDRRVADGGITGVGSQERAFANPQRLAAKSEWRDN